MKHHSGEYPCNECGIKRDWSIFSDEEVVGFKVLRVFPSESYLESWYVVEHQPSAEKDYSVIIRAWVNGSGRTAYMEKLK